ncbi:polyketide cyclase [Epidermidibacterium keratini]|uniref:Polyketide cyclase n=1 Tax=Epidermidibacterium keratini TaxID=1891644 RepID=A0A7L4YN03_9ACTN|nr:SRPBCC family protein [Epidermidibacterium keratini]QHC00199.1 polyketide cyclase [Epidermidibacterium keratini]
MKITVQRDVPSGRDADATFDYLLDFRNATEWDAGTVSCERLSGDGGPGTKYRNVSKFMGRQVELTYTVDNVDRAARRFEITGSTGSTTSEDTIAVYNRNGAVRVDYRAVFTFPTIFLPAYPLIALAIRKLGNDTAAQLEKSLRA